MYPTVEKMKPMLHVSDKDLPEIKDWKTGETYEVIVKMKMVSKTDYNKEVSAGFEVSDILVPKDEQDIDEMDNSEFNQYAGEQKRKMYG
jgi:hypothetical protein